MSGEHVVVFQGELQDEADPLRKDRLLEAVRVLWPCQQIRALAASGHDPDHVAEFLMSLRAQAGCARFVFSSNDPVSAHVARLLAARIGCGLGRPVTGRRGLHGEGGRSGVVMVDDRYFFARRAAAPTELIPAHAPGQAASFVDFRAQPMEVSLLDAELVLSAGDGVADLQRFIWVAKKLGAAIGATKVLCDKGLLPRQHQVGSSGTAVAPRVYVAFGISGSRQHLQGISPGTRVVAVNVDPGAPIMRRAELGIIADANAVLGQLSEALGVNP